MSNYQVKVFRGKEINQNEPGFGESAHIGRMGDLMVDPYYPQAGIHISDGVTPGGVLVGGGSSFTKQDYYASEGSTSDVIVDLTKKYHILWDLNAHNYVVNDGTVEGQELIFVPGHHANPANITVEFANAVLYYDAQTRFNKGNFVVFPWSNSDTAAAQTQHMRAQCRCVWLVDHSGDGAWYLDNGARDDI